MRRLFTFNSDATDPTHPPRRWREWAASTALLLALAEVALHFQPVRNLLPPRTHFYDPDVALRLEAMERTIDAHGRIDILFVGSSIVRTNIQPLLFDRLISDGAGTSVVSFNAGLMGVWPEALEWYVDRVWLPSARPKLVAQGIRYLELSATTPSLWPDRFFAGPVEGGWPDDASWIRRAYSVAARRVHLLQYARTWPGWLQQHRDGRVGDVPRSLMDSRGYAPARAPGVVEDEPLDTAVCGEVECARGIAALSRTIAAVHRSGARYVLVNVPERADRWRDPVQYRAYVDLLTTFARQQGVPFLDVSGGDPSQFASDEDYRDTSHMSPSGSARFTSMLARALAPVVRQKPDLAAQGPTN
jgi:hypothetical protein